MSTIANGLPSKMANEVLVAGVYHKLHSELHNELYNELHNELHS